MEKIILFLLLFVAVSFGQIIDENSITFSDTTLSGIMELGSGFCLSEIYIGSTFKGGDITLLAGDVVDTTNFVSTYDDGVILTYTIPTKPCRIKLPPAVTTGVNNWKALSDSTETCTIRFKSIYLDN